MERVDAAVIEEVKKQVLCQEVEDAIVAGVREALEPATRAKQAEAYRAELAAVERELHRLAEAIATTGPVAALVSAVHDRQTKRDELIAAVAAADAHHGRLDLRAIERRVRAKIAGLRQLLTSEVQDGRDLLRQILTGPLRFTPDERRKLYRFEGEAERGRLLSGVADLPTTFVASPPGFVALWNAELDGLIRR